MSSVDSSLGERLIGSVRSLLGSLSPRGRLIGEIFLYSPRRAVFVLLTRWKNQNAASGSQMRLIAHSH